MASSRAADWQDPNTVYACSQNINCSRIDLSTGAAVSIRPRFEGPENAGLRSRWDIPFIISPHSHTRLYIAANRLMRSDDRGATWKLVSPDLTRNIDRNTIPVMGKLWPDDTAVWKNAFTDLYGTGTAVAESPVKEGLLFVGTDDGVVAISEDSGETWRKVEKFPGVPDLTYVTDIFPSPHDANTVFVTFNDFQRGNFKPYVLKSSDLGKTWTSITADLPRPRPGLDPRAGPHQPEPAVRRDGVRPVVHGRWRAALGRDEGRDAGHPDPRPRDSEARDRIW